MTNPQARELRALLWSWLLQVEQDLPEEPEPTGEDSSVEPTGDELRERALALLEYVREATGVLDAWSDRLIRVASKHGANNPEIGARLGVGKERIRRRLLREPGTCVGQSPTQLS